MKNDKDIEPASESDAKKKKLFVVGWVDYDDFYYPRAEISDEVFDAVCEEVRKKGYVFGGDAHQDRSDCCPLLSDGTKAMFSWRGWGGVIAAAYDMKGKYSYMAGYMDDMIESSSYPDGEVDYGLIDEPYKTYGLPLSTDEDAFGITFHICAESDVTRKIAAYDYVDFYDTTIPTDSGDYGYAIMNSCRVMDVLRAGSFEEIVEKLNKEAKEYRCYFDNSVSIACGCESELSSEQLVEKLYKDYPREDVKKNGAFCAVLMTKRY